MYKMFAEKNREAIALSKTDSTNNELKRLIRNSSQPLFCTVSADFQHGGRGRLGREFFSPDGGLYFSASFPLRGDEKNIPFATLLTGLAACQACKELTGADIRIKWPNDLYLNGRKLGGILCELVSAGTLTAVVGVGINLSVKEDEIPSELISVMTSFANEGFPVPAKAALMKCIVEKLDEYIYKELQLFNVKKETAEEIRSLSFSIGKKVKYTVNSTSLEGVITDIKDSGAAEITLQDGTKKEIFFGEITQ